MRALVTGATGFIGSNVTRMLVGEGIGVRILKREGSSNPNLNGLDVETARGDLRDKESLRRAIKGCDALFHVAASYTFWSRNPNDIYGSNVEGTRNILAAAEEGGVERVVYTSTVSTIGPPKPGEVSDEKTLLDPAHLAGHYKKSKYLAEQEVLAFHRRGLPVVIVNPTAPVGRGDVKPTPTGKMVLDFVRRKMPAYIDTGLNVVDVDDVAKGHLLAYRKGRLGERYILGCRNMSLREIFETLSKITALPAPKVKIPYWLPLGVASLDEFIEGRVLRHPPRLQLEAVRTARKPMYVSSERAVRELGLPQTPAEEALEKAVRWFCDNGYIK
jgi:dihydroflavonol-4-reductase